MKLTRHSLGLPTIVVAAVCLIAPTAVLGATVKGKVANTRELLNPVWTEAKSPQSHRYTFREPSSSVPTDSRVLRGHFSKELCLVALSELPAKPRPKPIVVVVEGGRTSRVTLVVAPGQEIQFENHDLTDHAIYTVGDQPGGLSKGVMKPDGTRAWTPPGPGKYEFRDELSPSLRSWIVVEPRAASVKYPNRGGDFDMELDPGLYTLRAYYNGEQVGEDLPIEVKDKPPEQPLKEPLKAGPDKKDDKKVDPKQPAPGAPPTPPKAGG